MRGIAGIDGLHNVFLLVANSRLMCSKGGSAIDCLPAVVVVVSGLQRQKYPRVLLSALAPSIRTRSAMFLTFCEQKSSRQPRAPPDAALFV